MNIKKTRLPVSPLVRYACLGFALLAAAPSALAQATVWTGNASTSDWNTAGNWDNGVPVISTTSSATIALDGANVTMSAPGVSRFLILSGNGATAPVLNITQDLENRTSRFLVGSDASGTGYHGTVNHTSGTMLVGGNSGTRDLYIAHRATADTSDNSGTYNFGGASATAPTLDILGDLSLGNRTGESGLLSLSGFGTVKVGGVLATSRGNGTAEIRIEGGNLDISVANDFIFRGGGAGFSTLRAVIDNSGFSTIHVGGDVFFNPTNSNRSSFALELGAGYTHVLNTVFTIIDADGDFEYKVGSNPSTSDGRFGNVADNDILTVGGNEFRANYVTGDGTQFTITAIPEPSSVALVLVAGLATFLSCARGKGLDRFRSLNR